MKVDFWQVSRDPVEQVVALIAQRVRSNGERLLVVSKDRDQRQTISRALWEAGSQTFLAHGDAEGALADRQPILLAEHCVPDNGASHVVFADGEFRDPAGFARAFLLFDEATLHAARSTWKSLDTAAGIERAFFRQDGGKWTKIA